MKTFEQFIDEAAYGKPPKKGSVAWNAAQKRKQDDQSPERVKFIDSLGNKDHHYGVAKIVHTEAFYTNDAEKEAARKKLRAAISGKPPVKKPLAEALSYEHKDMVDKLGKLTVPAGHMHDFHTQLERNGHIHLDHGWHKDTPEVRTHLKHMASKGWRLDGTDKGLAMEPPK